MGEHWLGDLAHIDVKLGCHSVRVGCSEPVAFSRRFAQGTSGLEIARDTPAIDMERSLTICIVTKLLLSVLGSSPRMFLTKFGGLLKVRRVRMMVGILGTCKVGRSMTCLSLVQLAGNCSIDAAGFAVVLI